jgi:hypothetical protein
MLAAGNKPVSGLDGKMLCVDTPLHGKSEPVKTKQFYKVDEVRTRWQPCLCPKESPFVTWVVPFDRYGYLPWNQAPSIDICSSFEPILGFRQKKSFQMDREFFI